MPLYEYLCSKCGNKFEVIQKFADAPLTVHEGCGGTVERLISLSGFSLKGSGWYATDYAKGGSSSPKKDSEGDSSKTKADSKSTDSKGSESGESKSTESKPSETKTESKPASTTTKND
ncbi:MAG: zinc ribbon domain-containing protein [Acidobacteriia bacterium]|nr:zinc ribbon domain-containing protein [Terriglobia bacterium]